MVTRVPPLYLSIISYDKNSVVTPFVGDVLGECGSPSDEWKRAEAKARMDTQRVSRACGPGGGGGDPGGCPSNSCWVLEGWPHGARVRIRFRQRSV